jgi:dTDP-glucose 4,6-dehydratase
VRLLITGGAGFIGSNFIHYMLERYPAYTLINLDKLTYAGNLENLADIAGNANYRFVHGDICAPEKVTEVLDCGVDALINFAAESHVDRSILGAGEFVQTNILGTQNLLDLARKKKIRRFIQISSDEVYGSLDDEKSAAFTENTPLAPNSPYAASKASSDLLLRSYCRTYGFPGIITRCSNNYGPYQFPEKLIPLLVINAAADQPLPIYGDGMNVRDWIHVDDHCSALDRVLHHGIAGEVYNIGASNEVPNLEIARFIVKSLGKSESLLTFVKDRPGHDRRYAIDSTKLRRELGWMPAVQLTIGLKQTIEWYLNHPDWVDHVRQGAYRTYYERMYNQRQSTLSDL